MDNIDEETEIHYGVIPVGKLRNGGEKFYEYAIDLDYEDEYKTIEETLDALEPLVPYGVLDQIRRMAHEAHTDNHDNEEPTLLYKADGYKLLIHGGDFDVFVIKSPFVTYVRPCIPCAPNAGYLLDFPGSLETYCLGKEWFDKNKAPYKYRRTQR